MSQTASASSTTSATPSPAAATGPAGPAGPAGAAGQTASVPTVAGRVSDVRSSLLASLSGTPGRLRILALLAVAVSLIFGVGAFSTFGSANDALGRAGANAAQLVRIQAIHTNLIRADADATNAFLVGGLEPAGQRARYTASMAQASRLIAEAAQAQPADGQALGALNNAVLTYAGLIEQAAHHFYSALDQGVRRSAPTCRARRRSADTARTPAGSRPAPAAFPAERSSPRSCWWRRSTTSIR